VLGLAGAPNFRDLGGYATKDSRHVRWGEVYRSSALSALTPQDEATVGTLHIASEFDLRTAEERAREPDRWLHPPAMVVDSPKQSLRPMTVALLAHVSDAATARQAFIGLCARMPDQYRPEYSATQAVAVRPGLYRRRAEFDRSRIRVGRSLPSERVGSDAGGHRQPAGTADAVRKDVLF
jgi:hypothetical protein